LQYKRLLLQTNLGSNKYPLNESIFTKNCYSIQQAANRMTNNRKNPMATISLNIENIPLSMTVKAILEAEGHDFVSEDGQIRFVDAAAADGMDLADAPTVILAYSTEIPHAVECMKRGAWGYILLPLQPGEAVLTVSRILGGDLNHRADENAAPEELKSLDVIETEYIQFVLRKCKNNQAKAARILGIGRNTLWRKLKKIHGWHQSERDKQARTA
jgi:ActR/RegA family two-component response regulator